MPLVFTQFDLDSKNCEGHVAGHHPGYFVAVSDGVFFASDNLGRVPSSVARAMVSLVAGMVPICGHHCGPDGVYNLSGA